jgi:hypothetical protein
VSVLSGTYDIMRYVAISAWQASEKEHIRLTETLAQLAEYDRSVFGD